MERTSLHHRRSAHPPLAKLVTTDRFVLIAWGFVTAAVAALSTIGVRSAGWSLPIFLTLIGLVGMILGITGAKRLRTPRQLRVPIGLVAASLSVLAPLTFFVSIDTAHPERTSWGRGWYQNWIASGSEFVVTSKRFHPDDENLGCVSYRISSDEQTEICFRLQENLVGFGENVAVPPTDFLSCHGWSRGVIRSSIIRRRSTFDLISVGASLPDCWRQGIGSR